MYIHSNHQNLTPTKPSVKCTANQTRKKQKFEAVLNDEIAKLRQCLFDIALWKSSVLSLIHYCLYLPDFNGLMMSASAMIRFGQRSVRLVMRSCMITNLAIIRSTHHPLIIFWRLLSPFILKRWQVIYETHNNAFFMMHHYDFVSHTFNWSN